MVLPNADRFTETFVEAMAPFHVLFSENRRFNHPDRQNDGKQ
jgi:hypothetical protein